MSGRGLRVHYTDGSTSEIGYSAFAMTQVIEGMYAEPPIITGYDLEGRDY